MGIYHSKRNQTRTGCYNQYTTGLVDTHPIPCSRGRQGQDQSAFRSLPRATSWCANDQLTLTRQRERDEEGEEGSMREGGREGITCTSSHIWGQSLTM